MPRDRLDYSTIPAIVDRARLARQIQVAVFYPPGLGAPVGTVGLVGPAITGRKAQRVPVPGASAFLLQRPHFAIRFRNLREESESKGVHLADLFRPDSEPATLEGAADIVLDGLGGNRRELKFIINWPEYEPERSTISTISVNGGPLTRCELGKNIMYAYGGFFAKVVKERIVPSQAGSYTIALHQGRESRPDSSGVHLSQLHLVKFREPVPGDDHWFAEVDILAM